MLVMANLKLSKALQVFMMVAAAQRRNILGDSLYVSIRMQNRYFQEMVLYPQDGFSIVLGSEIEFVLRLAVGLGLDVCVRVENELPVVVVTDWNFKR